MELLSLEEVDSTNLYCKRNLDSLSDKTLVCATRQTSGRGRFSRKWVDLGSGNLFLSIVLKPSNDFSSVYSNLTQYLSVCLCKVLEKYGVNTEIKWPNDVLVNGKKISGILCETVMQGHEFKGLILGIGVNLNAEQVEVTAIPDKIATALNLELKKTYVDDKIFLSEIHDEFFLNYNEFLTRGFEYIKKDYLSRACFLEKEVCVQVLNEKKCGTVKGVNDDGALVIKKNDEEFVLTIGDIL